MLNYLSLVGALLLIVSPSQDELAEQLWEAARQGDSQTVKELIERGADVNAATKYGATALSYACDRGHVEVVQMLLDKGANPNAKDSFYGATPLDWAMDDRKPQIIAALVTHGAEKLEQPLLTAVKEQDLALVRIFLESKRISDRGLVYALRAARDEKSRDEKVEEIQRMLEEAGAGAIELQKLSPERQQQLTGAYTGRGVQYRIEAKDDELQMILPDGQRLSFIPLDDGSFEYLSMKLSFEVAGDVAQKMSLETGATTLTFDRVEGSPTRSVEETATEKPDVANDKATQTDRTSEEWVGKDEAKLVGEHWPSFRGVGARGVAEGFALPTVWDVEKGVNASWRAAVPGLGLSCPVVYGNRLFVTSAVSTVDQAGLKIGNYGDVDSVEDNSEHEFVVICLDVDTGQQLWSRTAHVGPPRIKRHMKSSHANPTAATDGRYVVASFGSEGLYCYDMDGNLIWRRDFGVLDSGWFYDRSYQWGFGSSPIIDGDRVYIQCDVQEGSFLAALDVATGEEIWRTDRDEIPTWSSPTVHHLDGPSMLITNGTRGARGYDAESGELKWWFDGHSEIVVPTPFVAHGLAYITSGYRPIQPIYAVNPHASGDLKAKPAEDDKAADDETTDDAVKSEVADKPLRAPSPPVSTPAHSSDASVAGIVWSKNRGGPYMPTPIVYGRYLYTCSNQGIVACYDAITGAEQYRERLNVDGAKSFVASPVAGDGKIFLTSEEGRVILLRAGATFEIITVNDLGTHVLSTPAIAQGKLFFRGEHEVIAIELQRAPRP